MIQPVESPKRVGMMSKDMPARDADVCIESLIRYHRSSEECETKSDLLSGKSQLEKLRPPASVLRVVLGMSNMDSALQLKCGASSVGEHEADYVD